jgi:alpha-tubulin suppressor-like RCC1 family protein
MLKSVCLRWTAVSAAVVGSVSCLGVGQEPDGNGVVVDSVTFLSVDVGSAHACGLVEGDLGYCWGNNSVGQLGSADLLNYAIPVAVAQGDLEFKQISAGGTLTCALTVDDDTYCWGQNAFGQLGIGLTTEPRRSPVQVLTDLVFKSVSAGGIHACALTDAGKAWCWGLPDNGQLGNGLTSPDPIASPDSVRGGYTFRDVQAGTTHTCGLTSGGDVYCWGLNDHGQLGDGTTTNSGVPKLVLGGILFISVDPGDSHTCGIDLDGFAHCWGQNLDGQLGTGDRNSSSVPVDVSGGLTFRNISAGLRYTCAVGTDEKAYCWGLNAKGEVGDGTAITKTEPTAVSGDLSFEMVSTAEGSIAAATCGFTMDGLVYCWGDGLEGLLGNGSTDSSPVPVLVAGQY